MNTSTAVRRLRPLLGTFVEIGAHSLDEAAVEAAFSAIQAVQRALSFQDPDSELSRLNRCGGAFVEVSPCTVRVLRLARAMMKASGQLFDCTIGAQLVRRGVLPSHDGAGSIDSGCADDIEIRGGCVRLRRPIQITLDGIAKGYAVDAGIRTLRRCGVDAGWINAGGDLRAFGPVTVPVYRREPDGTMSALGGLRDAAIATSATASRPSKRFPSRIVGPARTWPDAGVWSVLAHRAWRADALTKVAALLPAARREAFVQRLGGRLVNPLGAAAL